jgi:hypothetical protein
VSWCVAHDPLNTRTLELKGVVLFYVLGLLTRVENTAICILVLCGPAFLPFVYY